MHTNQKHSYSKLYSWIIVLIDNQQHINQLLGHMIVKIIFMDTHMTPCVGQQTGSRKTSQTSKALKNQLWQQRWDG